jgi:hypothetical protein
VAKATAGNLRERGDLMNRAIGKPKEQVQELSLTGDWDKLAARLKSARARETLEQ